MWVWQVQGICRTYEKVKTYAISDGAKWCVCTVKESDPYDNFESKSQSSFQNDNAGWESKSAIKPDL